MVDAACQTKYMWGFYFIHDKRFSFLWSKTQIVKGVFGFESKGIVIFVNTQLLTQTVRFPRRQGDELNS